MADFNMTRAAIELIVQDKASKPIKKVEGNWKKLVGAIAAGSIAATAANKVMSGLGKAVGQLSAATQVAARIQVLNRVFRMTGQNAGYSTGQLETHKNAIMALGIAEQEALGIGMRFIQSRLDLADATKVARAAQDLAVISGQNSSDTALALTDAIVKQRPILLKQYGVIADLNDIYGRQAAALDKSVDSLTKTEKRQAFLNEILRQSKTVAGAYTSAMQDVGKRLTSLPRHLQDAQNAVGKHFLPAMAAGVDGATAFLKAITRAFAPPTELLVKSMGKMKLAGDKFAATSKQVRALRDEYADLNDITEPSVKQQTRMNTILRDLEKLMPGVVLAIESETTAMRSNLDVLNDLVEQREKENREQEAKQLAAVVDQYSHLTRMIDVWGARLTKSRGEVFRLTQMTDQQRQSLERQAAVLRNQLSGAYSFSSEKMKAMRAELRNIEEQLGRGAQSLDDYRDDVTTIPGRLAAWKKELNTLLNPLAAMFPNLKDNAAAQERLNEQVAAAIILYQAEAAAVQAGKDAHAAETAALEAATAARIARAGQQARYLLDQMEADNEERLAKQKEFEDFRAELDQVAFDTRMIGLEEHQIAAAELEREHLAFIAELDRLYKELGLERDQEYHEARNNLMRLFNDEAASINQAHADKTAKAQAKHLDKLKADYMKKWKVIHDSVTTLSTNMARIIVTDSKHIGREMKAVFVDVGRAMVVNLVQIGLKALFEYIAGLAVAKTAAMAEIAVVKAQTSAYISLAAAKSAASLGMTTGASIAGAAATKAALIPMLMSGFDDPINDAAARRWGVDAGTAFMSGFSSVTGAPRFGRDTIADLQGGSVGGGDVINVTLQIMGNVIGTDEYVEEQIGPTLERLIRSGRSRLVMEDDNLTGRSDLGFV